MARLLEAAEGSVHVERAAVDVDLAGADAARFLNRMYTNGFLKLPVGKGRYGVMCGPDGMIMDDGVTLRVSARVAPGTAPRLMRAWRAELKPALEAAGVSLHPRAAAG